MGLDTGILIWIQDNMRSAAGDAVMEFFSHSADLSLIWVLIGAVLLPDKRTRRMGLVVLASMALCYVLNDLVLKEIFERPRPFVAIEEYFPLVDAPGYSFPSGHASSSFAAATAILLHNRKAGALAMIYALMVAFSRLYNFVHYPSDVIAGALLGIACAVSVFLIAEKMYPAGGSASGGQ